MRIGPRSAPELAWLGYNRPIEVDRRMHTVDRMLALLRGIGLPAVADMRLYPPPEDRDAVASDTRLAAPFAVIAPTSRWPGKRWPMDRFAATAAELVRSRAIQSVVVVGAKTEREQCASMLSISGKGQGVLDFVGQTSVGRMMALIERAALVIGNDSAALHMAVGLDRPLIGLYGPTDVSRVGPYRRGDCVVQHVEPGERFDHKDEELGRRMMERISVQEVLAKAAAIIERPAAPR